MFKEFDSTTTPNKEVLIYYFCDGVSPSIQAQTDECGQGMYNWEKTIEKAINTEAKEACQPQSLIKEIDNCCP